MREAQRLRYRVFVEEMGARLNTPEAGLDVDIFDAWCDHLLVRDEISNEVVGTYRILPPHQAKRIGSLYSESEFDPTRLANLRQRMVEVGRSCVHPDYRNGGTITLLWAGLAECMLKNGYDLPDRLRQHFDDQPRRCQYLSPASARHLGPIEWRVFPRCPLPLAALEQQDLDKIAAADQGYLRVGAYVCGEPAWDPISTLPTCCCCCRWRADEPALHEAFHPVRLPPDFVNDRSPN